jgi:hypothetical protein
VRWYGRSAKLSASHGPFPIVTVCSPAIEPWSFAYNSPESVGELVTWLENLCCDESEVKEER